MKYLIPKRCYFLVSIDVYYKDILFFFGYTHEQIVDFLSDTQGNDVEELKKRILNEPVNYKGITFIGKNGTVLIAMPSLPTTSEQHGTLIHEIFHAVEGIMKNIGNRHGKNLNESWAYLMGFISARAFAELGKYYI